MYKLIAIDMDGTLLNSDGEVSERNKDVLKKVSKQGVKVVVSTGRIFTSAKFYAKLLGVETPVIACNGAYVSEHHRDYVLMERPIPTEDCIEIVKIFEENNMYYHFYDHENFYTTKLDYNSRKYYEWNQKQEPENRINIEVLDNPLDFIEKQQPIIYKMVIMDKDGERLAKVKNILATNENIEIVSSWQNSFDIMGRGVSKGSALKELCATLNIKRDEVVALGDHHNDLSMIKFAGMGVAMGNGEAKVKEIANKVTDTNDNDGVAKAIEELIF